MSHHERLQLCRRRVGWILFQEGVAGCGLLDVAFVIDQDSEYVLAHHATVET